LPGTVVQRHAYHKHCWSAASTTAFAIDLLAHGPRPCVQAGISPGGASNSAAVASADQTVNKEDQDNEPDSKVREKLRWQQARAIFDEIIELPPSQREPRLLAACGTDAALLAEARSLLAADAEDEGPGRGSTLALDRAAPDLLEELGEQAERAAADGWVGTRLGAWQLQRQIGRGGMGAVYLAQRADGAYQQQAAVKLVRADWDSDDLLRRFHAERQILAQLNHPNIARLLDGGLSADGKPYLVLEYVSGRSFIDHCDALRLGIEQRLALFLTVCGAVEHAHRNLIVHRDLKPSNILVGDDGQVKLLDFGIAKMLESDGARTATAARTFTPEYAAPEQVRGEPVTTSVDVHALGLLLFELLSGERPYAAGASTPAAQERAILELEPPPPSRASRTDRQQAIALADARDTDPTTLSAALRGDLDAIVLMALRKDPAQRYASVSALADDIRRYLSKQAVQARQGHFRYHATRFLQRHALAAGLSALAVLILIGGLLLALWQADQTRQQRDVARIEAEKSAAVAGFLTELLRGANPLYTEGAMPTARDLLDAAVQRIDEQTDMSIEVRASLLNTMGSAYRALEQHAMAESLYERALEDAGLIGDAGLQDSALSGLILTKTALGKVDVALELARRRLDLHEHADFDDASMRRSARAGLGSALFYVGRFEEAASVLLSVHEELQGLGDSGYLEAYEFLGALSTALIRLGRGDEALAITEGGYNAAVADADMPLFQSVPLINAHAVSLGESDRFEDWEAASRIFLEQSIQLYGEDRMQVSSAYQHLAGALSKLQRNEEAIAAIESTVSIRRRLMDPDDLGLAATLIYSGGIHMRGGREEAALALTEEALRIYQGGQALESRGGIRALLQKARIHELRGEYQQATDELARVLPFVGGEPDHFIGVHAAPPLLLHARLQHREARLQDDCAPLDRILELDPIRPEHLIEARILAAACASEQGDPARAAELLGAVPEPLPKQELTEYARTLHQQLTQTAASSVR
jgi:serine/threonine-protein kinase